MSRIAIVSDSHDHNKHVEQIDDNWLLNSGELMGMKGDPTWALYDTDAHTVELKAVTT
jgi:predicted phosphodiesterase